jgi:SnoaL-like domain
MEAAMNDLAEQVRALQKTVQELSDRLEIFQMTASYAPAFDSGSAEVVASSWTEDGSFDVGLAMCNNRMEILELARGTQRSAAQQTARANGCGHVLSMPFVTVKGDTAVATCTSRFYTRDGDGFKLWRVTAVRMELVRTCAGWRIKRRINRLLDGSDDGPALYRAAFEEPV